MADRVFRCPTCTKHVPFENNCRGGASRIEVACWYCDTVTLVNRYKKSVVRVIE